MIAATLWRCTQNFCGARIMRRVEMRSEIRRAENVVTVMTYERTRCPILNQVPRPPRCLAIARAPLRSSFRRCNPSTKHNESFARISMIFYLGVRCEIAPRHASLLHARLQRCDSRGPRHSRCRSPNKVGKKCRPSFGVIEPENKDAPSPNSRRSC